MFLARRNSRCFSLLIETLPKGHFRLSTRVNLVARGRRCSIWKGAWGEFGWFLVWFVLLCPGVSPLLSPVICWQLTEHGVYALQHVLMPSPRAPWLAAPLAPGLAFSCQAAPCDKAEASGGSTGCSAVGGRPDQKVPACLEALQPQGCCICLGSDVAGWISITDGLLSIPLSQNAFIPHWIFSGEIRMSYPIYISWNRDNNDVQISFIFQMRS